MNIFRNSPDANAVAAGSTICRQDEPGDTMFAVAEGEVEVVRGGRVLETLGPGEVFGEMSLIDKSPRSADVRAKTDCRIVEINERRFSYLVQQTPFFALELMRTLSARLRHRLAEQS